MTDKNFELQYKRFFGHRYDKREQRKEIRYMFDEPTVRQELAPQVLGENHRNC